MRQRHLLLRALIIPLGILIVLIAGYPTSGRNQVPAASGALAPVITIPGPTTTTPQPTTVPTPDHNAVYRADLHVSTVTCVLPTMGTTNRQLEAWVQESVTCLDNAWQPVLATAGLPFSRPGVRQFSGTAPDLACTGDVAIAYYCPADKVISVSPDGELNPFPDAHRTGVLLLTMAHEYGHHIQELRGITEASDHKQATTATEAQRGCNSIEGWNCKRTASPELVSRQCPAADQSARWSWPTPRAASAGTTTSGACLATTDDRKQPDVVPGRASRRSANGLQHLARHRRQSRLTNDQREAGVPRRPAASTYRSLK